MKKSRILIALVICLGIFSSICINGYVNTFELEVGDVVGHSVFTNVKTFINGAEIQSYAINDKIFIAVEDLADYYFIVEWDEDANIYNIERDLEYVETDIPSVIETGKAGDNHLPILFTDIKVYFEGYFIRSYNLDGKVVIFVDDLAAFTGADYSWNGETKELTIDAIPYFIVDPLYQWAFSTGDAYVNTRTNSINRSFMYKFKNKTVGDEIKFNIVRHTGDYGGVANVAITGSHISFTINEDVKTAAAYWEAVTAGINVLNGARIEEDTHERRIELFETFKIFINEEVAGGELEVTEANGSTVYSFRLDVPMELADIDTVQIQVG